MHLFQKYEAARQFTTVVDTHPQYILADQVPGLKEQLSNNSDSSSTVFCERFSRSIGDWITTDITAVGALEEGEDVVCVRRVGLEDHTCINLPTFAIRPLPRPSKRAHTEEPVGSVAEMPSPSKRSKSVSPVGGCLVRLLLTAFELWFLRCLLKLGFRASVRFALCGTLFEL